MSRVCELTGKGRQVGNNVSHANNKTKRTFLPNLQNVTLISDALGQSVKLRVSTHGLRSVEHVGGLDNWLLKTSDDKLSAKVRKLKREISKKVAEAAWRLLRPRRAAETQTQNPSDQRESKHPHHPTGQPRSNTRRGHVHCDGRNGPKHIRD